MSAFVALKGAHTDEACAKLEAAAASGELSAAALYVRHKDRILERGFGKARSPREVFLLASITKPMTASAVMKLVDGGSVSLGQTVKTYVPEFKGGDRDKITVHHLLTHTSGLPDMLPENVELRKKHAPLKDFVAGACKTPLLFAPGTKVQYQSMGILLAAEIVERVTKQPLRDFLRKEIFLPLAMKNTSLGLGGRKITDTAWGQVTGDDDWNWNSSYWRDLGAPWGGAHSTAPEVAALLNYFLHPKNGPLRTSTAKQMIHNQNPGLNKPWGLGWMVDGTSFGKQCSKDTFGHWGSTGTVAWADPAKDLICVLLTTKPADQSRAGLLGPVSDLISNVS